MWRWADVREDVREDMKKDEQMREDVREDVREDMKMSRCEDEQMWEKMWRWADVKMSRCERRCEDEQMWRWVDVKMRRCEDEKVRYRPPLLEEPCAQTLSGKRYGSFITLLINRYVVTCTPIDDFDGAVMQQIARLGAGGTSAARKMAEAGGCFSQCLPGTLREAGVQVSQFLLLAFSKSWGPKKASLWYLYIYITYILWYTLGLGCYTITDSDLQPIQNSRG